MSHKTFATAAFKALKESANSHYSFKYADCKRLASQIIMLGFAQLLCNLSTMEAQTLALAGVNVPKHTLPLQMRRPLVQGTAKTFEVWFDRAGVGYDVYVTPDGRRFITRYSKKTGKARRHYLTAK